MRGPSQTKRGEEPAQCSGATRGGGEGTEADGALINGFTIFGAPTEPQLQSKENSGWQLPDSRKFSHQATTAMKHFCLNFQRLAGDESRTRDLQLGKLSLYRLSYTRRSEDDNIVPGVT
jgi:hypothetical protein